MGGRGPLPFKGRLELDREVGFSLRMVGVNRGSGNPGRTVSTLRLNLPSPWLLDNFRAMKIPAKCLFESVFTVKDEPIVHFGSINFYFLSLSLD